MLRRSILNGFKAFGGTLLLAFALGGGFWIYLLKQGASLGEQQSERSLTQHGWQVVPRSVHDGDTLRVARNGIELAIRLCGIDAPELDQPGGLESRDYLRSLLPDHAAVVLVPVQEDRYGRTVAEVWNDALGNEPFVNGLMVLAGRAWHYERYSHTCPNRDAIALAAERAGQPAGIPPWEWRQGRR